MGLLLKTLVIINGQLTLTRVTLMNKFFLLLCFVLIILTDLFDLGRLSF